MRVVLFDKKYDRSEFQCEEDALTEYLQKQVSQDINKGLATCFVAIDSQEKVIGYYTLTSESLGRNEIPDKYRKKVPQNYNVPVVLLGRLARDFSQKGKGLGEHLLIDALFRSYTLSKESIGAMAVVVDPINKPATEFYSKYGFFQLPDSGKMFHPMNVIEKLI